MTSITVEHVSKQFTQSTKEGGQRVMALNNASLKVNSGETMSILGPSGCGKSTLLRVIAGLIEPDSGAVFYDKADLRSIPLQERGVGMVFQDGALIPHWIAEQNIGFHLALRHREYEVPARVARISQITGFGLELLLERKPSQLSGGERQRVGIARALARDPRVFLFDEPFSNLDAKLRSQARIELHRLLNEFPVTSIYVTHDQGEAAALGQRVTVMREGRIEQIDSYDNLYHDPLNLFIATFIGTPTINLFKGVVRDQQWQGTNFGGYPLRPGLSDGTEVLLGVRAEDVIFTTGGVPARVEMTTPRFEQRHTELELRAGDEHFTMIADINEGFRPGDPISCALNPEAVLFFDPATGRRIN